MPLKGPIIQAVRDGEWLELILNESSAAPEPGHQSVHSAMREAAHASDSMPPKAGSHPHSVRQWLLAVSSFPPKWINRLFSVGGIRWSSDGRIRLRAFPPPERAFETATERIARGRGLDGRGDEPAPDVLYRDDYCLVLNKPAGMPVHASALGQRGTLDEAAERLMLSIGDPLPVRHIHRLDVDTSGPVLYSTNDLAQFVLDEAMRAKGIDRRYVAVVHGNVKQERGIIRDPIGKDRHQSGKRRVTPGGESAVTRYERLDSRGGYSLLRITLETGRTHQIRVHMSHVGHPLVGDGLYGGQAGLLHHQALHGERLLFPHPLTGDSVEAESPWPDWLNKLADRLGLAAK